MGPKLNILLIVIVGAALDAVSAELIDNQGFNFTGGGWKHLLEIGLVGAFIAFAAFFRTMQTSAAQLRADHAAAVLAASMGAAQARKDASK